MVTHDFAVFSPAFSGVCNSKANKNSRMVKRL